MLSRRVWETCRLDAKYLVCFVGAGIVRLVLILFSTFMLLWITSFVDSGLLPNEKASKDLYSMIVMLSIITTLVVLPVSGCLGDRVPTTIMIPVSFGLRGLCGMAFLYISDPRTTASIILCVALITLSMVENVCIEATFMKGMPSDIRGIMVGFY